MQISAVIQQDENGYFGYCPELPGCHSQGRSLEVVMTRVKDAATLYLRAMSADERNRLTSARIFITTIDLNLE
jgi:predicted RNase H-like HicB family nuclease